ncbi:putative HXXXD-type acyl-transferase family protein [Hibiscus syriacus]|uniref:HXXXD-type acyl-transferase family protein n=1 Tax=Hibiscus syriacus TaxID=106335 RepID=A0A6A3D3Z9_HIBSY|nr:zinc carboxypeptidase-like [Hibiscus syriacus]KAE8736186.1 putative HXXXD-type acyl-transferase family protein [Hibiscus syriacus]
MAALFLLFSSSLYLLACFPSFPSVYADAGRPQPFQTPINRDLYHSGTDLIEKVESLVHRHPDKLTVETLKSGTGGYNADVTVVTYGQSGNQSDDKSKSRILLDFGQHSRELITSELALRIVSILGEEQFLPGMDHDSLNLENLVIKLVPLENLNGRKLVEAGKLCERRNGRGVDLNRNWGVDWGRKEKDYDPAEEYPGTAPFSEPETKIIREIATSFNPHIWVNVHSGTEALFMPYDHKNSTPDGLPGQRMRALTEELNMVHCHGHCKIGSGGTSVGYLAHGTATDYMYEAVRVPMSFTFEIYAGDKTLNEDCFKMFNPVDQTTFERVLDQWCATLFALFKLGPREIDVHSTKMENSLDQADNRVDVHL